MRKVKRMTKSLLTLVTLFGVLSISTSAAVRTHNHEGGHAHVHAGCSDTAVKSNAGKTANSAANKAPSEKTPISGKRTRDAGCFANCLAEQVPPDVVLSCMESCANQCWVA